MALLDIFKKREKEMYAKKKEHGRVFTEKKKEEINKETTGQSPTKSSVIASKVLVSPHLTEKATSGGSGLYIFKVRENANKPMIRKAVEEMYEVNVEAIKVIRMPEKKRFVLGRHGRKGGYKKAIVTLRKGQVINFV